MVSRSGDCQPKQKKTPVWMISHPLYVVACTDGYPSYPGDIKHYYN